MLNEINKISPSASNNVDFGFRFAYRFLLTENKKLWKIPSFFYLEEKRDKFFLFFF